MYLSYNSDKANYAILFFYWLVSVLFQKVLHMLHLRTYVWLKKKLCHIMCESGTKLVMSRDIGTVQVSSILNIDVILIIA